MGRVEGRGKWVACSADRFINISLSTIYHVVQLIKEQVDVCLSAVASIMYLIIVFNALTFLGSSWYQPGNKGLCVYACEDRWWIDGEMK